MSSSESEVRGGDVFRLSSLSVKILPRRKKFSLLHEVLLPFRDSFACFEFGNSKFCACNLENFSSETRNFKFANVKF